MVSIHLRSALIALCLGLSGCGETLPGLVVAAPEAAGQKAGADLAAAAPRLTAQPGVSPSGATIAFISLDGLPTAAAGRVHSALSRALGASDVATAPSASANYLVQGHLSAWRTDKGVAISWVWDVYNSGRQRLHRLEDQIEAAAAGSDPWSSLDGVALDRFAADSARELAAFLSNTPEAAAAAKTRPALSAVR